VNDGGGGGGGKKRGGRVSDRKWRKERGTKGKGNCQGNSVRVGVYKKRVVTEGGESKWTGLWGTEIKKRGMMQKRTW